MFITLRCCPIFYTQMRHPCKFTRIIRHHHEVMSDSLSGNLGIEGINRHSLCLQKSPYHPVSSCCIIIKLKKYQWNEKLLKCLLIFSWIRTLLDAYLQFCNRYGRNRDRCNRLLDQVLRYMERFLPDNGMAMQILVSSKYFKTTVLLEQ